MKYINTANGRKRIVGGLTNEQWNQLAAKYSYTAIAHRLMTEMKECACLPGFKVRQLHHAVRQVARKRRVSYQEAWSQIEAEVVA